MKSKAQKRITALRNLQRDLAKSTDAPQSWRDRVLYEISVLTSRLSASQILEAQS